MNEVKAAHKNDTVQERKFTVIPAIDVIEGKCVRLTHGDYSRKKIYNEDPLEAALQFQDAGIQRLHLVDLDGAKAGRVQNWKVLERIASRTSLSIDFGGGIKSEEDVRIVFESGAVLATIGSMAVKDEESFTGWLGKFGAEKFFLGADVKDEQITISGWLEQTQIRVYDFLRNYLAKGVRNFFCTDVSKDGALQGPSTDLYKKILGEIKDLELIASGGVSNLDDVYKLKEAGCSGVIIGKAIYEGRVGLSDLARI
jgi:phosphoribosylformimino-5-aminoimidazole carboxamide ribotide isomerase